MDEVILDRVKPYHPTHVLRAQVANTTRSIRHCSWFRPIKFAPALLDNTTLDLAQRELLEGLQKALLADGHTIQPAPTRETDLMLGFYQVPEGEGPLEERIREVEPVMAVAVRDRYDLDGLHPNLIVALTVTEDLLALPHVEMEQLARMAKARIGAFKLIFIKVDPVTRATEYYMFTTIEGGHPVIDRSNPHCFEELRDRLVTHACAREAGGYEPIKNAIPEEAWEACRTVDNIIELGRWMGQHNYLDPPWDAEHVTTSERAQLIRFLLGWQRQAAGAMIAFAPDLAAPEEYRMPPFTGTPIVTCTGRDGVDKTNLHRDDVVAVALKDGILYAFGVAGRRMKGPSIEGDELVGGMMASPPVRLAPHPEGYVFDPQGEIVVPRIWAIVHTHRAVEEIRPILIDGQPIQVVEHIQPNIQDFPYAVGCGKDIMFEISRDGMSRAAAAADLSAPTLVGVFDVANHGTNFFIYCAPRPGTNIIPRNPFENFIHLLKNGTIKLTTEIPQI